MTESTQTLEEDAEERYTNEHGIDMRDVEVPDRLIADMPDEDGMSKVTVRGMDVEWDAVFVRYNAEDELEPEHAVLEVNAFHEHIPYPREEDQ